MSLILIVIPHIILKKSHLITGSPRMISLEYLLKIKQKTNVFRSNDLAKVPCLIKTFNLPKKT